MALAGHFPWGLEEAAGESGVEDPGRKKRNNKGIEPPTRAQERPGRAVSDARTTGLFRTGVPWP